MATPMDRALARAEKIITEDQREARRRMVRQNVAAVEVVRWLNSGEPYLKLGWKEYTTKEANALVASAIAHGDIVEIPGDPYRWELA